MANITGTIGADIIIPGLEFNGTIPDLTGDDTISGEANGDVIAASSGNDSISGGDMGDTLFGNQGQDTLYGDAGSDSLFGGKDNDVLDGGDGDDFLHGDLGTDIVRGGAGNDAIGSNSGEDTLYGGTGNDTFFGGKDADVIFGEDGDDVISGDIGGDVVSGGAGNDTFIMGRNADGTTTGGATVTDADTITDFVRGTDKIQLTPEQKFSDLTFIKSGGSTIVQDKTTSQFLATVQNVADLDATDFQSASSGTAGAAGTIEFSSAAYSGQEAAAGSASPNRVTITVNRTGGSSGATTVNYSTAAGANNPAEAATDYTEVTNGVLSWADGESGAKTFEVLLPSDGATNVVESAETFSLILENATNGAVLGSTQTAVVTINDGAAVDTGAAPKLVGAELLVGDAAGSSLGKVSATGATSFSIKSATSNAGATVENPITVDTSGNLTLTAAGATALNSVNYLDVVVATDKGAESTIRVYGNIDNAVKDSIIGDVLDISDGTGQNAIRVGAGSYAEAVNLNKEAKLLGASANTPGVAPRTTESELTGLMTVAAGGSNAEVDGFKFSDTGRINISAVVDKLTIENNIFSKQAQSAISTTQAATNLTVKANLFEEMTATPVNLTNVATSTITQNTFKNIRGSGTAIDAISLTNPASGATISSNMIENVTAGRGIDVTTNATPGAVLVSRNTLSNINQSGIYLNSAVVLTGGTLTATGNKVTNANAANVGLTSTASGEAGITLNTVGGADPASSFSITGNDLNNNNLSGVLIDGAVVTTANAIAVTGNNLDTNNTATFAAGGVGLVIDWTPPTATPPGTLNATNNYWGVTLTKSIGHTAATATVPATPGQGNISSVGGNAAGTSASPDNNILFAPGSLTEFSI